MSKKYVAMIPARLGSKRVPNKNIRLINGKPLVSYIIESVVSSGVFDEIYLNSESDILRNISEDHGINFYKRPEHLSSDDATNDDFTLDFINNIESDVVFQFLPTSPFVTKDHIIDFYNTMIDGYYDTLISTTDIQIECLYENLPLNYNQKDKTLPSQLLEPIKAYACGLMAWDCNVFKANMYRHNSAYHGGDGSVGFYNLSGFASVDIDTADDFLLAQKIAETINSPYPIEEEYYDPSLHSGVRPEVHVPSILRDDGVGADNYDEENMTITNLDDLLKKSPDDSWMHRLVNTESNSCCVIHQRPGEGNRKHYHPSWNEWWYILKGEWDFEIGGKVNRVKKGDLVFIPKNSWHKITCVGNSPAARIAVSREDVVHVYKNDT
jgi:CMP-N,N'-diacetyllegionaminic acid synthase